MVKENKLQQEIEQKFTIKCDTCESIDTSIDIGAGGSGIVWIKCENCGNKFLGTGDDTARRDIKEQLLNPDLMTPNYKLKPGSLIQNWFE